MQVTCSQEELNKGLGIVSRGVSSRSTIPIMQNVLLVASGKDNTLKLCATNGEIYITCWVPVVVETDGAITVPAHLLSQFIASLLGDQSLELNCPEGSKLLEVTSAHTSTKLGTQIASGFPMPPDFVEETVLSIDPTILRTAISRVALAAAEDMSRPILTGILMNLEGETLTLVAADGYRLAIQRIVVSNPASATFSILVPAASLTELRRVLGEDDKEPVQMLVSPNQNQVVFSLKNVDIMSLLLQGQFPNYQLLMPKEHTTKVIVALADLQSAVRTASIFAKTGASVIRLQVENEGKLLISAQAGENGDHESQLDVIVEGEPIKIAFNNRYLADLLNVLDGKEIILGLTHTGSPGTITMSNTDTYQHILMPMFVSW